MGARPNSVLIFSEGQPEIGVQRGYYVFWYEYNDAAGKTEYVHQYMGVGDALTQVNIENWLTKYTRKRG